MHQGSISGGHYYAYIRPDGKAWCKFDDERVSPEDSKAAIEGQWGELSSTMYGAGLTG